MRKFSTLPFEILKAIYLHSVLVCKTFLEKLCVHKVDKLRDIRKDRIIKECNEPLATEQEKAFSMLKNLLLAGAITK